MCWTTLSWQETLVLYRMRPTVSAQVSREVGRARPIQRFEGSRPWGGVYAYSMVLGAVREAPGTATGVGKSKGRTVLVEVGRGRNGILGRGWEQMTSSEAKQGAHLLLAVMSTECGSLEW